MKRFNRYLTVWFLLLGFVLNACQFSPPHPTLERDTTTETPLSHPTVVAGPNGDVYGDPGGRFSLPLVGDWIPVETDGSFAQFTLADPAVELYVVTVESNDFDAVVDAALSQIGVDASTVSLLVTRPDPRWNASAFARDDGHIVALLARELDGTTVAIVVSGEGSAMAPPPAQVFLTVDGLSTIPLVEYLKFRPPPAPGTIETIENLDHIAFYSGRQKLAGRLLLPEGEGPFPAIVFTGPGSGLVTRFDFRDAYTEQLLAAGFAVFSYDKRGVGDSEGLFMQINALGSETSEWRLPQLADDALAAVAFLQNLEEINPDQIGLWGASQNGWTIPLAASRSSAPAFAVIVSGSTVSLGEEELYSELTEAVDPLPDDESLRAELSAKLANFDGVPGFDPREAIENMSIPGLWIWGDRDGSMPARESKAILESIIAEHDKDFTIYYDPDAGHRVAMPMSETVEWILSQIEK